MISKQTIISSLMIHGGRVPSNQRPVLKNRVDFERVKPGQIVEHLKVSTLEFTMSAEIRHREESAKKEVIDDLATIMQNEIYRDARFSIEKAIFMIENGDQQMGIELLKDLMKDMMT